MVRTSPHCLSVWGWVQPWSPKRKFTPWGFNFPLLLDDPADFKVRLIDGYLDWRGHLRANEGWWTIVHGDPVCAYCGATGRMTADHITPVSEGGQVHDNLTAACPDCNGEKSSQPLLKFLISIGGIKCSTSSSKRGTRGSSGRSTRSSLIATVMAQQDSTAGFPTLREALSSALGGGTISGA